MSEEADNEEFEAIVSSEEEGEDPYEEPELENLWDVVDTAWPIIHKDEGILVRGMMIVEVVTPEGLKDIRILASPEMMSWDIQGFLKYTSSEMGIEQLLDMLISVQMDEGEDVEGSSDDEE